MESLSSAQRRFAGMVGKLITWVYTHPNLGVTFGDAYATQGHMAHSCHYLRLAVDLNLFVDGQYRTDTDAYRILGDYWKTLAPDARWGGDFAKADGNHFSITWEGRA